MILQTQFKRFKRECLVGRSAAEVHAAKDIFFCGAGAAVDSVLAAVKLPGTLHAHTARRLEALAKEMRRYQIRTEYRKDRAEAKAKK